MNIEDELISFLENHIVEHETKARNIEIIAYYYGFRGSPWPTLEETAKQYNIGTRERVRQLIKANFRDVVNLGDLPTIESTLNIIKRRRFWSHSELERTLTEVEVAKGDFHIKGLFNLMDDLGLDNEYEIYLPNLEKATRNSIDKYEQYFIIKSSDTKTLKPIYKKAKNLPGRCGIPNINYLEGEFEDFETYKSLLKDLIKYSENAWSKEIDGNFWYLFENKHNTLINYSEKIFSVIESCEANKLSETYRNALDRRTNKYPYPPIEIISNYLISSIYFENYENTLMFLGETTKLNGIEVDIVDYLKSKKVVNYQEFRSYLASKGYGEAHIIKDINSSPFVYIDKSEGRYHHKYSLVGNVKGSSQEDISNDRYSQFVLKLRKIAEKGTDETIEQKKRREQRVLQQWLFENKNQECCAICGSQYNVGSLVSAHKKKRAKCNEAERLDPYIIMPVCVFGCDYLYENRHIYIENGMIKAGLPFKYEGQEQRIVKTLIGRKISEEWLKGQSSYFEAG